MALAAPGAVCGSRPRLLPPVPSETQIEPVLELLVVVRPPLSPPWPPRRPTRQRSPWYSARRRRLPPVTLGAPSARWLRLTGDAALQAEVRRARRQPARKSASSPASTCGYAGGRHPGHPPGAMAPWVWHDCGASLANANLLWELEGVKWRQDGSMVCGKRQAAGARPTRRDCEAKSAL